jgi:hypothetical protein
MSKLFKTKLIVSTNILFGIYGFSREWRSTKENENILFLTHKIGYSLFNGLVYASPPFNFYFFYRLINRIEIQKRSLNKKNHINEYIEISGRVCNSTF